MGEKPLEGIFEQFVGKPTPFLNKQVLQSAYTPQEILHRDKEIGQVAEILAPTLRQEKPSNLFVYGKTGTGKTLTVNYVINELSNTAKRKNIPLQTIYTNCKLKRTADTEYRVIASFLRELGKDVPLTGLPTGELYTTFLSHLKNNTKTIILILDEIDYLVKKVGDNILYNLIRLHESGNMGVSIVGISNDVTITEMLDPRVKSSLSEEEAIFPPYNALQIQDILKKRAQAAFKQNVLECGVIEKCAAYSAREHGDVRRALELLRVAGEVAERKGNKTVALIHVDEAESKIDRDRIFDVVSTQPKQYHLILYSILCRCSDKKTHIFTGDVYGSYAGLCTKLGIRALTQRRVSDIIAEFDMLGVINATIISKGRYGRTREITIPMGNEQLIKIKLFLEKEGCA